MQAKVSKLEFVLREIPVEPPTTASVERAQLQLSGVRLYLHSGSKRIYSFLGRLPSASVIRARACVRVPTMLELVFERSAAMVYPLGNSELDTCLSGKRGAMKLRRLDPNQWSPPGGLDGQRPERDTKWFNKRRVSGENEFQKQKVSRNDG